MHTVFCTLVTRLAGGYMLCCSHYVAREYARSPGAFSSVLRVVHNCAPIASIRDQAAQARRERTDTRPRLMMVGTLESHKDHETLIKAMSEVVRVFPDVQLWLAGEGSLRGQLEALSASLGLKESVIFLGTRRDVPTLLGQSDVFVFATTPEEGLGTVLVEALAAETPVVASDVPACREALADGQLGTLVQPSDPNALAAVLISRLQKRGAESGEAREFLERFSPAAMIAGYMEIFA